MPVKSIRRDAEKTVPIARFTGIAAERPSFLELL
jgi:hypothetical protein